MRTPRLRLLLLPGIVWLALLAACSTPRAAPSATATPDIVASVLAPTLPAASEDAAHSALFDGWTVLIYSSPDANRPPLTAADVLDATIPSAQLALQIVAEAADDAAAAGDALPPGRYLRNGTQLTPVASGLPPTLAAASLADFVTWGSGALPARYTALILSGYGAVHTTAPHEIAAALRAGQLATGAPPLDVVVLDAGLSARLDLLVALRDVARYAVVTAEPLLPGALVGLPLDAADGAAQAAYAVAAQLVSLRGSSGTPWAVVDLAQIGGVGDALDILAGTLGGQIGITGAPFLRAVTAAAVLPELNAIPGTRAPVALGALAASLAVPTLPNDVSAAAAALRAAQGAALTLTTGPVASDFPLLLPAVARTDDESTSLPTWHALLDSVATLAVPAPAIELLTAPALSSTVSAQLPALLRAEFSGRQIASLALVAGARDGATYRLGYYEPLPAPAGGWADGVHIAGGVWPTRLAQLSDDERTTPVVSWPLADGGRAVAGLLLDRDDGRAVSVIVFDAASGRPLRAWRSFGYPQAEPLTPDRQFAPHDWTIGADGTLAAVEGEPLAVGDLRLTLAPAAPGTYFAGIHARTLAGASSAALRDVVLSASEPITGYQPYVDPTYGFRLLYPADWQPPVALDTAGSLFASSNLSATQTLQIKAYAAGEIISGTQPVPLSAEAIKAVVLAQWQDVAIVYEDATTVGSEFALRTAYGYFGPDGERRGVLLTFIHKEIGYAIDLDLPVTGGDALLPLADALAAGWLFVPYALTPDGGRFATLTAADRQIIVPEGFAFETLDNGWQRYRDRRDGRRFFALRSDPPGGGDAAAVARGWLDVVVQDVADIALSDASGFALAGQAWSRYDFRYTAANGAPMRGLLMSSVSDSEQVVWAEAPEVDWATFVETVLAIVSTAYGAPR